MLRSNTPTPKTQTPGISRFKTMITLYFTHFRHVFIIM